MCAAAGTALERAVRLTIYMTDLGAFAEVNEVYGSFFADDAAGAGGDRRGGAAAGRLRRDRRGRRAVVLRRRAARRRAARASAAATGSRARSRRAPAAPRPRSFPARCSALRQRAAPCGVSSTRWRRRSCGVAQAGDVAQVLELVEQQHDVVGVHAQRLGELLLGAAVVVAQVAERHQHGAGASRAAPRCCAGRPASPGASAGPSSRDARRRFSVIHSAAHCTTIVAIIM